MGTHFSLEQHASHYIRARACPSGGFCFYRLDEPNPHDTYFALAALNLLHTPCHDKQTIQYLQAIQKKDGSFDSLAQSFFVMLSLKLLETQPLYNPAGTIEAFTDRLIVHLSKPADASASLFNALNQLTALRVALQLDWQEGQRETISRALRSHHHLDGGFGVEYSTLLTTYLATVVLQRIGYPVSTDLVQPYLCSCEHPVFGYTGKPGSSLYFLEYLHAGLALSREISFSPSYPEACFSSLLRCQTDSGGFARTHLAIATLENTYFAICGLQILSRMMNLG